MLESVVAVAEAAGKVLREKFNRPLVVKHKGSIDLVTEADQAAEAAAVAWIRSRCPDHDIVAEEGDYDRRGKEFCWIIDPLDGTTNYAHGFPWFAVSVALARQGEVVAAAVLNPVAGHLFTASRGGGAFLNGERLQVSRTAQLDQALLATGFPYDCRESEVNNYDNFIAFQQRAQACRRPGAASLDLCWTAAGRFDGYWEMKLKPWDVAAGQLLVTEAGGCVSDFDGGQQQLDGLECLASNGPLHRSMCEILQQGRRPERSQLG